MEKTLESMLAELEAKKSRKIKSKKRTVRKHQLAKYGLTVEQWDSMFDSQNGCCAFCGKPQSELSYTLGVNRNRSTRKIRSLLCTGCNAILGLFEKYAKDVQAFLDKYDNP